MSNANNNEWVDTALSAEEKEEAQLVATQFQKVLRYSGFSEKTASAMNLEFTKSSNAQGQSRYKMTLTSKDAALSNLNESTQFVLYAAQMQGAVMHAGANLSVTQEFDHSIKGHGSMLTIYAGSIGNLMFPKSGPKL